MEHETVNFNISLIYSIDMVILVVSTLQKKKVPGYLY